MGKANRGEAAFEHFYGDLYGERWAALRQSLLDGRVAVAFDDYLSKPYYLDAASILAARALRVESGDRVLDLCAAPGGKSLVIASELFAEVSVDRGELVCNERSSARRARLHRVLNDHLPARALERIRVTGHDAARWALYQPEAYDRVLADVPCSSEQHVIQSPSALAEWSPSRTRRLAQGAYAIACAGFDALVPGGRLVYSTCALSPRENDAVVTRLLDRADGDAIVLHDAPESRGGALQARAAAEAPGPVDAIMNTAERTEHGLLVLPDVSAGAGPIYFAVIAKNAS